jgi:cell division protein FtsI/penicillin-binding protein 2
MKNVQRIPFYNHQPSLLKLFPKNNLEFLKVKQAMRQVVEDPAGTGRRARVDFVKTAIKTGTAGSSKEGLDSIIFGFFPFDNPRFAFAFRLKNAGRAEYRGALFFKQFLKAFYNK